MLSAGLLTGPTLTVHAAGLGERSFAAGDHVIVQRNNYHRGVLNGTRAVVTDVDPVNGDLSLRDEHGLHVALDARHLTEGRLDHGYATTCHKAQGLTLDVALIYGTDALTREAGYVALSRGRRANHLDATTSDSHRHLERAAEHDLDDTPLIGPPSPRRGRMRRCCGPCAAPPANDLPANTPTPDDQGPRARPRDRDRSTPASGAAGGSMASVMDWRPQR